MTLPFNFSKASLTLLPSILHKLLYNSVDRKSLSFTWHFQQIRYAWSWRKCQDRSAVPDCVLQDQERVSLRGFDWWNKRGSRRNRKIGNISMISRLCKIIWWALIDEAAPTIPEICLRPISLTLILRFFINHLQWIKLALADICSLTVIAYLSSLICLFFFLHSSEIDLNTSWAPWEKRAGQTAEI